MFKRERVKTVDCSRVEAVKLFMGENGMSQAALADMIGMAASTFNRWLNNDLPNPKKQDEKIDSFLEKMVKRIEKPFLNEVSFVRTNISDKILDVLEYCRIQKTIGCVYGDAGIGKTITVKHWSEDKSDVIVIFASRAYRGGKAFLKALAKQIKARVNGCTDDIFSDIVDKLSKSDMTIVIDEAQRLSLGTLEDIRDINELTNTPIILVGNAEIYNKILGTQKSEYAQLFSRIGVQSRALLTSAFTLDDVKQVFPGVESSSQAYLLEVARSKYGLRGAVAVYVNSRNNENTSAAGLKAMAKTMGIMI